MLIVLPGTRFGRLTAVSDAETTLRPSGQPTRRVNCVCDCGEEITAILANLLRGHTKSCGCLQREITAARSITHGKSHTKLFDLWVEIRRRAVFGTSTAAVHYKGRGIGMYQPWINDFASFYAWVNENLGECPKGHSMDRIDNDASYEPGNLRWATRVEQANNKRNNKVVTYNGEARTIAEWGRKLGVSPSRLGKRIRAGWSVEKALMT